MFKKISEFFENLIEPCLPKAPDVFPKKLVSFIWFCTKGFRFYILILILCNIVIGAFDALVYYLLSKLIDQLNQISPQQLLVVAKSTLIQLTALLLLNPIFITLQSLLRSQTLNNNFPMRMRWNFHRILLNQSVDFFHKESSGRVAAKVMQTAQALQEVVHVATDVLVFSVVYFLSSAAVMGHFDTYLLVPFVIWLVLYATAALYYVPRAMRASQGQAAATALMSGRMIDAYTNITTVKLFTHNNQETRYARTAMLDCLKPMHRYQRFISGFEIVSRTLNIALIFSTAATALWFWMQGQIGVGAVAAATAITLRFSSIAQWAMWAVASLFESMGTVQDGVETLLQENTVQDRINARPLNFNKGEIRFENVCFSYGKKDLILDQFNLHIKPGEKIGLVGYSGAGKSTLINLLLRFYELRDGRILIDGQNIAQVTQDSLRQQIGVVTQDSALLHRSLRDNIFYGNPQASEAQFLRATTQAQVHGFVQRLSDSEGRMGYDVEAGERGVRLSGGQRQRIAVARTLLKNAPILLLDEATSALDSETEALIQISLKELMQGKTVIAIAHRLSTVMAMDRLLVMDKGRVVEQGSHAVLLAQGGVYAQLWAHQSKDFLQEKQDWSA
jgi:ATP-binding cassette subfamily B multidrug efflux pump